MHICLRIPSADDSDGALLGATMSIPATPLGTEIDALRAANAALSAALHDLLAQVNGLDGYKLQDTPQARRDWNAALAQAIGALANHGGQA